VRAKLIYNRLPQIQHDAAKALAKGNEAAADELREVLQRALDDGSGGIQSDTRALASSLYVKATGRNDYSEALAAAKTAFTTHSSRYHKGETEEARARAFERVKADHEPLHEPPEHVCVAAVATMLAYGNKWEFERDWMKNPTFEWAHSRLEAIHAAHLREALS